jgi:AraC-like DNA-binding protein
MDVFDLQSTNERTILDLRQIGIQDLPVIGHYTYRRAAKGLTREAHEDHFEVTFLAKGVQIYETEGQRTVLRGGDLYLTRPGERHSTAGQPEEKGEAFWIFLRRSEGKKPFLGLEQVTSDAIMQAFQNGKRSARASADVTTHLAEIYRMWSSVDTDPFRRAAVQARVRLLAIELAYCFSNDLTADIAGPISKALDLLRVEGNWDISLGDLAKEANLSEARFKVRFKAEVGIPPGEYLIRRRIEKAKYWLRRSTHPIMKISSELCFPTAQYFATVFKRYTGMRPQDYRDGKK